MDKTVRRESTIDWARVEQEIARSVRGNGCDDSNLLADAYASNRARYRALHERVRKSAREELNPLATRKAQS